MRTASHRGRPAYLTLVPQPRKAAAYIAPEPLPWRRRVDPVCALVWLVAVPGAAVAGWWGLYRLLAWLL